MKRFSKKDLNNGMVVELISGKRFAVIKDVIFVNDYSYIPWEYYNNDLTCDEFPDFIITKVYEPKNKYQIAPCGLKYNDDKDLIWERPEYFDINDTLELLQEGKIMRSLYSNRAFKLKGGLRLFNKENNSWDKCNESFDYSEITSKWIEVNESDLNESN